MDSEYVAQQLLHRVKRLIIKTVNYHRNVMLYIRPAPKCMLLLINFSHFYVVGLESTMSLH